MNILITGCFAPGTSGTVYALRQSEFPEPIKIYGIDANLQTKSLPEFEQLWEVHSNFEGRYIGRLIRIVTENDIDLIIPQTTRENLIISKYQQEISRYTKILVAGSFTQIALANDKYLLTKLSGENGLTKNNPVSFEDYEKGLDLIQSSQDSQRNLFFKARNLSGGRGIFKVSCNFNFETFINQKPPSFLNISFEDLRKIWNERNSNFSDFFLENEVAGTEYSVDIFRSKQQFISIPRKRLAIRNGISQINLIENNQKIIKTSEKLAKELNLFGVFGFQFIQNIDNELYLLECNPRVQGTNLASVMAGSNIIEYAVKDLLGIPFTISNPVWNSIFTRISYGEIQFN